MYLCVYIYKIIIMMTTIIKEEEVMNLRSSWGHGRKWRGTGRRNGNDLDRILMYDNLKIKLNKKVAFQN